MNKTLIAAIVACFAMQFLFNHCLHAQNQTDQLKKQHKEELYRNNKSAAKGGPDNRQAIDEKYKALFYEATGDNEMWEMLQAQKSIDNLASYLNISKENALKLTSIRIKYKEDVKQPGANKRELKRQHERNVRSLLTDGQYEKWNKIKNGRFDSAQRKDKFTASLPKDKQSEYISLLNKRAITLYKIKKEKISPEEKYIKTQEVETKFELSIIDLLSADQYTQWLAKKKKDEERRSAKTTSK